MKNSTAAFVQTKRFQYEEWQQHVSDLENMLREFEKGIAELDRQIREEEERAGVFDVNHYAYPPVAVAIAHRRDNLLASVEDLNVRLVAAREKFDGVRQELNRLGILSERGQMSDRVAEHHAESRDRSLLVHS